MISRESQVPLYVQLADEIREQIKNGEIRVGDKLPSEAEMIEEHHLGRLTVREALSILVNEGLIEKQHGKGTFCKTNVVAKKYRVDILLNLAEASFIPYYLRSICAVLESENVNIVMGDTRNDPDVICNLLDNAIMDNSDGVIFQPANDSFDAPEKLISALERLSDRKIPYIMIDTYYRNVPESYVVMDEYQAGKIAADFFVRTGHTSLCAIGSSERVDSRERIDGFASGLVEPPCIIESAQDLSGSLKQVLDDPRRITGIFCYNDGVAKCCYDALAEMNVKIPDRISVISVDDTIVASTLSPTLTSVIHPKEHLGTEAAKALLDILSGESTWPYKKVFQPSIAIRKSCRSI